MNNIQQLENQLKEAKNKEKQERLEKELKDKKDKYEGCWSTHRICRFNYPGKGFDFNLVRYYDFQIKDDKIVCKNEQITCHSSNNNFTFEIRDYSFLNSTDSGMYMYDMCRYKISQESFEKMKNQVKAYLEKSIDNIRLEIPLQHETITIGDNSKEEAAIELLLYGGDNLINVENIEGMKYITILELLTWYHHPYLIGKYLLNNQTSKKILQKIIDDLTESARKWGGSIWERDYPRIQALNRFLNETNWK